MEYRTFRQREVIRGHLDRPRDQRGLVIVIHRPPDDLACRAVNYRRDSVESKCPRLSWFALADLDDRQESRRWRCAELAGRGACGGRDVREPAEEGARCVV